jgi:hypothetical protein
MTSGPLRPHHTAQGLFFNFVQNRRVDHLRGAFEAIGSVPDSGQRKSVAHYIQRIELRGSMQTVEIARAIG